MADLSDRFKIRLTENQQKAGLAATGVKDALMGIKTESGKSLMKLFLVSVTKW